jgi:hypothetical protein
MDAVCNISTFYGLTQEEWKNGSTEKSGFFTRREETGFTEHKM